MKLKDFYDSAVIEGIRRDPRGEKGVRDFLLSVKKEYDALGPSGKDNFDMERLANPYADTRILFGKPGQEIKNILAGIDMESQEILFAEMLKSKGKAIDMVLSHHPEGFALSALHKVMDVQLDLLENVGVSRKKAKKLLDERIEEVSRRTHSANIMRPVDTAAILGIPFMCAHTVADNCVSEYLQNLISKNKPKTVQAIVDLISEEPEYKYAIKTGTGPRLILGKLSNPCGKVIVEMTGGTGGSKKIFPELVKAGVKTIISMHMSEDNFKKAKKHKLNILIAGHISSDSLGLNILLDSITRGQEINIIPCSGFIRVKR
ncbi:MAG: NGG1p interacting factor NIF3 [Candidatus Omnitrophica bacterium]|nr:NGG1p interacting factor NIF3 [Candidatus Omnitrophota bacterium]